MVTLQILVLSFLVRIQVAQLKRSSFLDRFFCFVVFSGERGCLRNRWLLRGVALMQASVPPLNNQCQGMPLATPHHGPFIVVPPDSHLWVG